MTPAWRHFPRLFLTVCLLLALGLGLGAHSVWTFATGVFDPAPARIDDWMSPNFVAATYGLPPVQVAQLLGLPDDPLPFVSIRDLGRSRGEDPAELVARLQTAVLATGAAP